MNTKTIKLISILEILGGIVSFLLSAYILVKSPPLAILYAIVFIFILLSLLGIYAGIQLWKGTSKGVYLSKIVQAAQVFKISSPYLFYQFFLGAHLTVGIFGGSFNLGAMIGGQWSLSIAQGIVPFGIGINLIAVWALFQLKKLKKQQ